MHSKSQRPRAAAALQYPLEPPAPGGQELVAIAPDVLWARIAMPISLSHINVYLLRDTDGWVLVDTGLHHDNSFTAWQTIARHPLLQGMPFKALVCTHYHYDHAGMARWLCQTYDIPLYMTRTEHFTMRTAYRPFPDYLPDYFQRLYAEAGMSEVELHTVAEALRQDPFITQPQESYIRIQAGDVLHIGQRRWHVLVGGGHAPEHACLYSDDESSQPLLLAGDQLISRISSNVAVTPFEPYANPMAAWLQSLDMLENLDPLTWVLPAHQGIFTGIHLRTQELREHHHAQFAAMERFVKESGPVSAAAVMQATFPKLRNPIDKLLALGETVAHLNWLLHAGRMVRTQHGAGTVAHYQTAQSSITTGLAPCGPLRLHIQRGAD